MRSASTDATAAQAAPATARAPVALVTLLGAALLINYVDRGSLSTAAPLIEKSLHLSPSQLGWVLSAFFWAYVASQPLMGWLADTVGAARVLAAGFLLWSVATFLTGLTGGLVGLVCLRLFMGVGESVTYPCALALLAQRVGDRQRARATSVLQLGGVLGPACGTFIGGLVMYYYGWRAMFMALGLASLLWLPPWSRQLRAAPPPRAAADPGAGSPSFRLILRQRALWGVVLGNFCSNYAFYFVFTWLPLYLVHERGLSLLAMTRLTTAIYLVDAGSTLLTGWWLDRWMQGGASANLAYKTALVASAGGVGACLLGAGIAGPVTAALLLLATGLMDGLTNPAVCSATQHFAGPLASGRWMGVQNACSNMAGVIAPLVTGYLVESTGHYRAALWVAGSVALLGLVGWLAVVPRIRPVDWHAAGTRSTWRPSSTW